MLSSFQPFFVIDSSNILLLFSITVFDSFLFLCRCLMICTQYDMMRCGANFWITVASKNVQCFYCNFGVVSNPALWFEIDRHL